MKIEIIKARHKGFAPVSWVVRLIQRTAYSHYAIAFVSDTGTYMVLDATSKNVALKEYSRFAEKYTIIENKTYRIEAETMEFRTWYERLLGESYGFLQLVGVIVKDKRLGRGIICNELVLRLLRRFTNYNDSYLDIRDLNYTAEILKRYEY